MTTLNKDQLWSAALDILSEKGDDVMNAVLNTASPLGITGNQLILVTSSNMAETLIKQNYNDLINAALCDAAGENFEVTVFASPTDSTPQQQETSDEPEFKPAEETPASSSNQPEFMNIFVQPEQVSPKPPQEREPAPRHNIKEGNEVLFSSSTFDSFVVGASNQFAYGAALAVAEQPGTAYNPLFIYGGPGLGKTHLLIAIANYISDNYPNMRICYAPASDMRDDYVSSLSRHDFDSFNSKYRNMDVLLIDDVQTLSNSPETVNQLFDIFNKMTSQSKQVVLSADRAPKDIDMDDRMRTRFEQGIMTDIQPPDYETRLAIIKNLYAAAHQTSNFYGSIPDDVLEYVAVHAPSSVRGIQGVMTQLTGVISIMRKSTVTKDEAATILNGFFSNDDSNKEITISTIQQVVENHYNINHDDLIGNRRSHDITMPRHIAIYLCRMLTAESSESIGKKFGGRNHATILYSATKIESGMQENRELLEEVEKLREMIIERS